MARTKFCSLATLWQISLYFIPRWNLFYFVRAYLHFFCLQKYCEAAQIVCGLPLWNMLLRIASSPNPQTCTFNFYSTGLERRRVFFPHVVFIHHLHFLSWLCSRSFQFEVITRHVIKQGDERLNLPMYKKKKRMHSQIFVLHTLFFFFFQRPAHLPSIEDDHCSDKSRRHVCHFCAKPVHLIQRRVIRGEIWHRTCFR